MTLPTSELQEERRKALETRHGSPVITQYWPHGGSRKPPVEGARLIEAFRVRCHDPENGFWLLPS